MKNADNIAVSADEAALVIYGSNPMKKDKLIKLATIRFEFVTTISKATS